MTIDTKRYTSGRIALANLSASIDALDHHRFADLLALSKLLFLRGDLLGRIADHDRAERAANEAVALSPDMATALCIQGQLVARFHRFAEAAALLDRALQAGYSRQEIDPERASLLQATGQYRQALAVREKLAQDHSTIHTRGALASLLAEMGEWQCAEACYAAALDSDNGTSPIPCSQLLFEWGVSAMRRGDLDRAEEVLAALDTVLPQHVPGRAHRAEVALARRQLDLAEELIKPILSIADDPEYCATYAEILVERAAVGYDSLLARRPEAYADHAAAFFMGIGNRPQLAAELAAANWKLRDTPRSRKLLDHARRIAEHPEHAQGEAA